MGQLLELSTLPLLEPRFDVGGLLLNKPITWTPKVCKIMAF